MLPNPWVVVSALMYAAAFIAPAICNWLVFLFLVPLYWWVGTYEELSVRAYAVQGFWWGVIFFSIHMCALTYMLVQQTSGAQACVVVVFVVGYCALVSACWFAFATVLARGRALAVTLCIWALVTCGYIEFIERFLFRVIALPRGYVFAYPLVPLAEHAAWLASLAYVSPWVLSMCISGSAAAFAYALLLKKAWPGILVGLCFFPFGWGWLQKRKLVVFPYADFFVYAQPPRGKQSMPLDRAQQINVQLSRAVQLFPKALCICFPESTYPFALDIHHDVRALWEHNALAAAQPDTLVIMGSHHAYGDKRANTIFCLDVCRIILTYDKTTYLPFAEYIPWPWNKSRFLSELLLKNKIGFHQTNSTHAPLKISPQLIVCPYLCSDLFFGYPRADDGCHTLLWLVNDSWFELSYYQHLLFLFARLQARVYQRNIIYVGHGRGSWLTMCGQHVDLPCVMIFDDSQ